MYCEAIEEDAKNWEYTNEAEVEYYISRWLDECEILTIEICKYCIRCYVTNKEDGADDGESQLAHTLAEEHDTHERKEDDQYEENTEAPWTCTFVTLEVSHRIKGEI